MVKCLNVILLFASIYFELSRAFRSFYIMHVRFKYSYLCDTEIFWKTTQRESTMSPVGIY